MPRTAEQNHGDRSHYIFVLVSFASVLLQCSYACRSSKTKCLVALAKSAGSGAICLTNLSPDKPFATCLVGVPVPAKEWPVPNRDFYWCEVANMTNPVSDWYDWALGLLKASFKPHELEILVSLKMEFCAEFHFQGDPQLNVHPHHSVDRNSRFWCNSTTPVAPKGNKTRSIGLILMNSHRNCQNDVGSFLEIEPGRAFPQKLKMAHVASDSSL